MAWRLMTRRPTASIPYFRAPQRRRDPPHIFSIYILQSGHGVTGSGQRKRPCMFSFACNLHSTETINQFTPRETCPPYESARSVPARHSSGEQQLASRPERIPLPRRPRSHRCQATRKIRKHRPETLLRFDGAPLADCVLLNLNWEPARPVRARGTTLQKLIYATRSALTSRRASC